MMRTAQESISDETLFDACDALEALGAGATFEQVLAHWPHSRRTLFRAIGRLLAEGTIARWLGPRSGKGGKRPYLYAVRRSAA